MVIHEMNRTNVPMEKTINLPIKVNRWKYPIMGHRDRFLSNNIQLLVYRAIGLLFTLAKVYLATWSNSQRIIFLYRRLFHVNLWWGCDDADFKYDTGVFVSISKLFRTWFRFANWDYCMVKLSRSDESPSKIHNSKDQRCVVNEC